MAKRLMWKGTQITMKHLHVLRFLEKRREGASRTTLMNELKNRSLSWVLGPRYTEDLHARDAAWGKVSLQSLGLVVGVMNPSAKTFGDAVMYKITERGRECLKYFAHVTGNRRKAVVPYDLFDPVVKKLKERRGYEFEAWTPDDLDTLRMLLPPEYITVPLETLREQMLSRRKDGVYGDEQRAKVNLRLAEVKKIVKGYWEGKNTLDEVIALIEVHKDLE